MGVYLPFYASKSVLLGGVSWVDSGEKLAPIRCSRFLPVAFRLGPQIFL